MDSGCWTSDWFAWLGCILFLIKAVSQVIQASELELPIFQFDDER